jgi:hypothetical protein
MRDRFLEFASHLALPKLYGISALGTHFSVYEYHPQTRRLTSRRILPHPDILNDIAPQERWNYDVMQPGEAKLRQLVSAEIKKMAAALAGNGKRYSFLRPRSDAQTPSVWLHNFIILDTLHHVVLQFTML